MKLLAALDFSHITATVVATAQKLAAASRARVILLHVIAEDQQTIEFHPTIEPRYHPPQKYYREPDASEEGDAVPILHDKSFRKLQDSADTLNRNGVETSISIVHGETVRTIIEQAEKEQADFILVGSRGHTPLYRLLVGSVCSGVVSGSSIPVIVVPKAQG